MAFASRTRGSEIKPRFLRSSYASDVKAGDVVAISGVIEVSSCAGWTAVRIG